MYTGTTVLGEFSELQYSLSPNYQAARLLVLSVHIECIYWLISHLIACYANGSVISITYMSRHAIDVEQISKHVFQNILNNIPMWVSLWTLEALKFSFFFFLLQ